ncbi:hypothetical protein DE146DRAFT_779905 [Phaeosphaeria sp. MPI-PUGE-AT-0046c]|nr:hypothetical protein DE146DRAFT_779905 [Phaeosphaeria sp. MPI-PUGE-AT-0046c]
MKLPTRLILAISAIPYASGCLRVHGSIQKVPDIISGTGGIDAGCEAIDNGRVVCSAQWGSRIDQDNHYSISCLPGYVWAFTKNGAVSWYSNGVNSFQFDNDVKSERYCCVGACDDKGPKFSCTDYYWDKKLFGC